MAMTEEEFQAFQEALEKGRAVASSPDQHKELAQYEKQAILQAYQLVGEAKEGEITLKSKFDTWVDHCLVAKLEDKIKEYRHFYQCILCYGKKKQKEFTWQQMANIILSYDSTFVHRLTQNNLKLRKLLTVSLKEELEQTTNKVAQKDIKDKIAAKKLLADKIVYEMVKTFKTKGEKQKGKLCLNEKTATGYLENTIALYEMLAGSDGSGEFAPIFDNVTSRTQDFWKTNPKELQALLTKLKTNLYEKGEEEQSLSTKEIISISKRCGTFFKESDAKKLEKVAHEFMQFKHYILNEFLSKGGDNEIYDKIDNLTFKDILIQAPTIGCKDSSTVKFNLDLLMGKAFKESLKDAKVKTDEPTHYLFKDFNQVKVNGDHHDLADLLLKAPTSVCISPYTIVDIVNFVDKTFKESRYAHSNIKEGLLTVNNFSDLNLVRTKDLEEGNCLTKLTTLFTEEKLFGILQKDLTLLNIKEDILVEELKQALLKSKGEADLEKVVIDIVKKSKKQQLVDEEEEEREEQFFLEEDNEDVKERENGKRSKNLQFIMSLEDYEKMLDGLEFNSEEKAGLIKTYKETHKEYFEKQARLEQERLAAIEEEKRQKEEFEKAFAEELAKEKEIEDANALIQQELNQKRLREELEKSKAQKENEKSEQEALQAIEDLTKIANQVEKSFNKENYYYLLIEEKETYYKQLSKLKREAINTYIKYSKQLYEQNMNDFAIDELNRISTIEKECYDIIKKEAEGYRDEVSSLEADIRAIKAKNEIVKEMEELDDKKTLEYAKYLFAECMQQALILQDEANEEYKQKQSDNFMNQSKMIPDIKYNKQFMVEADVSKQTVELAINKANDITNKYCTITYRVEEGETPKYIISVRLLKLINLDLWEIKQKGYAKEKERTEKDKNDAMKKINAYERKIQKLVSNMSDEDKERINEDSNLYRISNISNIECLLKRLDEKKEENEEYQRILASVTRMKLDQPDPFE